MAGSKQLFEQFNQQISQITQTFVQQFQQTFTAIVQEQMNPIVVKEGDNEGFQTEIEGPNQQIQQFPDQLIHDKVQQDGDLFVNKAGDHEVVLAKLEYSNPSIYPVCDPVTHNKVKSLLEIDFLSHESADKAARGMFYANQKECNIANKVFDKMPERDGYIPTLNPKPPDEDSGAQFSKLVQTASVANFETKKNKKIIYVGVNASVVNFSSGRYFSGNSKDIQSHLLFNAGFEAVGLIAAVGDLVSHLNIGSPAAIMSFGGYAEFTRVPSKHILLVARADPEVVAMLTSGLIASISLEKAAQMDNRKLFLIIASARRTGQFAVQLAKLAGNTIVVTCGGNETTMLLIELGADRVIDYKEEDIKTVLKKEFPKGVDIIYETVGGQMFDLCLNALPIYGLLVAIGMISQYQGEQGWKPLNYAGLCEKLLAKSQPLAGFFLNHYTHLWQQYLDSLVHLYSMGLLKVAFDPKKFLSLKSVADAVEHLHSGTSVFVIGKCGVLMFLFIRLLGEWATMASQVIAAYMMVEALNKKGYNGFAFSVPLSSELKHIFTLAVQVGEDAHVKLITDAFEGGRVHVDHLSTVKLLNFVDIFSLNESELARLTGMPTESFEQISQVGVKCHELSADQVLLKLVANGSSLFSKGEEPIKQPIVLGAKVLDTTGADDTFTAAFAELHHIQNLSMASSAIASSSTPFINQKMRVFLLSLANPHFVFRNGRKMFSERLFRLWHLSNPNASHPPPDQSRLG